MGDRDPGPSLLQLLSHTQHHLTTRVAATLRELLAEHLARAPEHTPEEGDEGADEEDLDEEDWDDADAWDRGHGLARRCSGSREPYRSRRADRRLDAGL